MGLNLSELVPFRGLNLSELTLVLADGLVARETIFYALDLRWCISVYSKTSSNNYTVKYQTTYCDNRWLQKRAP